MSDISVSIAACSGFPLAFATFGDFDNQVLSFPDKAVNHGNGVRQGPKARTQQYPTYETTG